MSLPHIKNSKAGMNREDPIFKNLFEVYFSIPEALAAATGAEDVNILTEQVKKVQGLDSLTKTPETQKQTYMGATRTYLGSYIDDTSHTITVDIQLNLRNVTDNYIFKLFKNWNNLGYNMSTGERTIAADHYADFLRIVQFARNGSIFRDVTYRNIILTGVTGMDELSYEGGDIAELQVIFVSDFADDIDA